MSGVSTFISIRDSKSIKCRPPVAKVVWLPASVVTLSIWRDKKLTGNDRFDSEITERLLATATLVAVLPAILRIDMARMGEILGKPDVELATDQELTEAFPDVKAKPFSPASCVSA